ncbi:MULTISPECIES: hypothetical protein [unclassified Micromonospora]|uniref:hypothetical protein n=1 Tax=unclassified Micromonospora TaxID=2617518 RepID=UPI001C600B0C|nr:hypothetical protein [Micromonospora sp. RL09-050-HVF-A]MBW4703055.1 hypothetical protein [Micromonospora sp. RL09-050-HVF-A]
MDTEWTTGALQRYVLAPDEATGQVWVGPESVTVKTDRFRYRARPAQWAVVDADWLAEAVRVVAARQPMFVTHGLLRTTSGGTLHLNRPGVMAELGRRVGAGLEPSAYAELLGELCSAWTIDGSVVRPFSVTEGTRAGWLIRDPDHFTHVLAVPDAPAVTPPTFVPDPDGGWTLRFFSHNHYLLEIRSAVDVYRWTVTGGPDRAATWVRETVAERVERPLP